MHRGSKKIIRWTVAAASGIAALLVLWWLRLIILPFALAAALTYILEPLVTAINKTKLKSRRAAVIVVYAVFLALIITAGQFLLPAVAGQFNLFLETLPDLIGDLQQLVERIQSGIRITIGPGLGQAFISDLFTALEDRLQDITTVVLMSFPALISTIGAFILAPVLAYYMLVDISKIKQTISKSIPAAYRDEVLRFLKDVDQALANYVRGQLIVAGVVAVVASIGLAVLQIRFALVLGLIAGLFEVIPYFGPILGAMPAVVVALVEFPARAVKVIVLFAIIQQLDAALISPRVIGSKVGLHPLTVIFALLVGGKVLGLVGLLIAVPVTVIGRVVIKRAATAFLR